MSMAKRALRPLLFPSFRSTLGLRFDHSVSFEDTRKTTKSRAPILSPTTHVASEAFDSNIIAARLKESILRDFSDDEVKSRIELAAAYRLFGWAGWNENIYNHLTVGITEKDGSQSFLINPHGLRYDEITASSLLKINLKGEMLHPGVLGDIFGVNRAGFVIHSAIHEAKGKEIKSVMHSHYAPATAVASTKDGFLDELTQTSEIVGEAGHHDFWGLVVDPAEQPTLVSDLGDKLTLFLRNHGVITLGDSIGAAWYRMFMALRACEMQIQAQSAAGNGGGLLPPGDKATEKTRKAQKEIFSTQGYGQLEFSAYMRLMDKIDPSYRA